MGLIRKTLAVSTVGAVSPSSKKQRVANAGNQIAAAELAGQEQDRRFRYETDASYRSFIDAQRAESKAAGHLALRFILAIGALIICVGAGGPIGFGIWAIGLTVTLILVHKARKKNRAILAARHAGHAQDAAAQNTAARSYYAAGVQNTAARSYYAAGVQS